MSTSVCAGDVVEDAEWGSSGICVRVVVGATWRDVEATGAGVDGFLVAFAVLTLGPLEAALPRGGLFEGAVLSVSQRKERKPLGFLKNELTLYCNGHTPT